MGVVVVVVPPGSAGFPEVPAFPWPCPRLGKPDKFGVSPDAKAGAAPPKLMDVTTGTVTADAASTVFTNFRRSTGTV
ncbi:hypothetical protein [Rhodococcus sp. KBS0724]|uniref:hypothetical protein n=1 Tax=Rhodococcus sp. KBS0724 TaxID=1179674 RepID=UPI001C8F5EAF|nr:hypothetical protein [Rhodococcus sp. KBS0724]